MTTQKSPPPPRVLKETIDVTLERRDFMYYNWTLALERPVLPFFIYTFTLLVLASLLGLWPNARAYAFIVLVPMLGHALLLWLNARGLWSRLPELRAPRSYTFKEKSYLVDEGGKKTPVPYEGVRALESRRGFYLIRDGGTADLLPKRNVHDEAALRGWLEAHVGRVKGSSFL